MSKALVKLSKADRRRLAKGRSEGKARARAGMTLAAGAGLGFALGHAFGSGRATPRAAGTCRHLAAQASSLALAVAAACKNGELDELELELVERPAAFGGCAEPRAWLGEWCEVAVDIGALIELVFRPGPVRKFIEGAAVAWMAGRLGASPSPGFDACERCGKPDRRGKGCPWCANEGQIKRPK